MHDQPWFADNSLYFIAGLVCIVVRVLAGLLEKDKDNRTALVEGLICGILVTFSKPYLSSYISDDNAVVFIGAVLGYVGPSAIRPIIDILIKKKAP